MIDNVERRREEESDERESGNWRVVVSAWVVILLFVMLLAAVDAVASRRGGSHPGGHLAGAVIPQHDPCAGPGIRSAPGLDGCQSVLIGEDRSAYW
jgi:hypothetical protein